MPSDQSVQIDEEHRAKLEESYWTAILNEGEYAKSTYITPESSHQSDSIQSIDFESSTPPLETDIDDNDWIHIKKIYDNDETVTLAIIGFNRGGLLVEWHSLRGFVPASQLVQSPTANDHQRRDSLASRMGDILNLRVIELNIEKNRLIFSERAAQVEAGKRNQILNRLHAGMTIEGIITNLCDFGAFVDLGGIEGLIHISELSWGRVAHPADMLSSGDTVQAYVLDVNEGDERIALSLKRLYDDPWENVQERYQVGEVIEGRITNVVDFGAFACIEEGLEGLIHFSELAEGQFLHPRNVVAENDVVQARILSIDSEGRRLGLSLRHI